MRHHWKFLLLAAPLGVAACSSSGNSTCNTETTPSDGGINSTFTLPFTPTTSVPGQVQVTYSGETFGELGLPYPTQCPTGSDAPPFAVDGWSLFIDEYLVAIDNIRLTGNAAQYLPQNQLNAVVASKPGIWVFDGHKGEPGFVSTDGVSPAGPIFAWNTQDDCSSFSTTEQYAFSYDVVPAAYPVTQVNLGTGQFADYDQMVQNGWSKFVRGHAVFAGTTGGSTYPPDAGIAARFNAFPTTIYFSFGWDDSGGILNCDNPALGFDGEDQPSTRGIKVSPGGSVPAQVTLHVDHLFWDTLLQEGTPLRFDQVAAWATSANSSPSQPLELNTLGVLTNTLAATFSDGTPLPDRAPYPTATASCYVSNQPNPNQVHLGLNGVPATVITNLADFMAFSAQAQMHMNADGLCYNVGQHVSDPWYAPGLPKP